MKKYELKIVRSRQAEIAYCSKCKCERRHLNARQMARIFSILEIAVFRLAKSNAVHSFESADGKLLICEDSAIKLFRHTN